MQSSRAIAALWGASRWIVLFLAVGLVTVGARGARGDDEPGAKFDDPIKTFDEAIRRDPQNAMAYADRGRAWLRKREYDKALPDLNEAIRRDPENARAHIDRALVWDAKDKLDKAIADLSEAIRLQPENHEGYLYRALASAAKKDFDKAIADFSTVIRLVPTAPEGYLLRGIAWGEKKEFDKAIADYSEAIRLEPEILAYPNRGFAWIQKTQYDKAIADFEETARRDPRSAYSHKLCAWFWATCPVAKYCDGKKAVESATRACELTGWKEPDALSILAAAYARADDFRSAVKWQTKANALLTDGKDKTDGAARLKLYQEKKPYRETAP